MMRYTIRTCRKRPLFYWIVPLLLSFLLYELGAGIQNELEPFVIGTIKGNVHLPCNISVYQNFSALSVIWKHNDVEIIRCGISCSLTQYQEYTVGKISPSYLLINGVQLHHAGRYSCLISTTTVALQSSVTLRIEVPPSKLTIRDGETNATFRSGALVPVVDGKRSTLTCETDDAVTQRYGIFWNTTLNNQPDQILSNTTMSASSEEPRLYFKTTVLSFVPELEDNGKHITCLSVIDMLTDETLSVTVMLDVKVLPKHLCLRNPTSNETLHKGQNLRLQEHTIQTLLCETNPPVKPSTKLLWETNLKDKHIISRSNGTLVKNASGPLVVSYMTITFISHLLDDGKTIKCDARNTGMTNDCISVSVTLDIEVPPTYLVLRDPVSRATYRNNDIVTLRAGMEKTLVCETEPPVKPGVQLEWNTTVLDLIVPHHVSTQMREVTNPKLVVSYLTFTFRPTSGFNGKSISCETAQNTFGGHTVSTMVTFSIEDNDYILETTIAGTGGVLVICVACGVFAVYWCAQKRNENIGDQQEPRAIAPASPPVIRLRALPPIPQPQSPQLLSLSPARGRAENPPSIASTSGLHHASQRSPLISTSFTRHPAGAEVVARVHADESSEDYADLKDESVPSTKPVNKIKNRRIAYDDYASVNKTKNVGQKIRHILIPSASGMDEYAIPDKRNQQQISGGQSKDSPAILTQPTDVFDMEYAAIND